MAGSSKGSIELIGEMAENLIQTCNNLPYDLKLMLSEEILNHLQIVGQQMSVSPLMLANMLFSCVACLLGKSSIGVSPTWEEPILFWSVTLGMKSSGKSPSFQYILDALTMIEKEETLKEQQIFEQENQNNDGEKTAKKAKKIFDSKTSQLVMNGSTWEGLQDVLRAKERQGKPAAVIYAVDEWTNFFHKVQSDQNFETNVLQLYTSKMVRSNTRKHSEITVYNPFVQFAGYTQHESFIKEASRQVDTGGSTERFTFVAPERVLKNREKEKEVEDKKVVPLKNVFRIIYDYFYINGRKFSFDKEAGEENDKIIDSKTKAINETNPLNNFLQGLNGKGTSKRIRLCPILQALEAAFKIATNELEASEGLKQKFSEIEREEILQSSVRIKKTTVIQAEAYINYSNEIAIVLHNTQHSKFCIKLYFVYSHSVLFTGMACSIPQSSSSQQPWLVDLGVVEMSPKKAVQFHKKIAGIYLDVPRSTETNVKIKAISVKNLFPGLKLESRTKFSKSDQCLHFMKCLAANDILKVNDDETEVVLYLHKREMTEKGKELMKEVEKKEKRLIVTDEDEADLEAEDNNKGDDNDGK